MTRESLISRLEGELGLDRDVLGAAAIDRLIRAGTRRAKMTDESAYLSSLETDEGRWSELVEDVVVPETWFFRDRRPFELIRALGAGWAKRADHPVRVLSLPCSTGEEAYSVAISLIEGGVSLARLKILAVDLSERNLSVARAGLYRERSMRLVEAELRSRYFRDVQGGVLVRDDLRCSIEFCRGNAVDPNLLCNQKLFDLILCRNLLIYLRSGAREKLLDMLSRHLVEGGYLLVGHAERGAVPDSRYRAVEQSGTFAFRKGEGQRESRTRLPEIVKTPRKAHVPRAARSRPEPSRPASTVMVVPSRPDIDVARQLADVGEFDRAEQVCDLLIRRDGPSGEVHHILGSIGQARGELEVAERHHRRAVYLDPHLAESLLALSFLARRRGDQDEADRLARRAERANDRGSE